MLSQTLIDINRFLTKEGAWVVSFQPRVELPTPELPSILLRKAHALVLEWFIFLIHALACCFSLSSSDGSQERSLHTKGEGGRHSCLDNGEEKEADVHPYRRP